MFAARLRNDLEHRFYPLSILRKAYTCQGMYRQRGQGNGFSRRAGMRRERPCLFFSGPSSFRHWQFQPRIRQGETKWKERAGTRQPGDIQGQPASLNVCELGAVYR